MPLKISWKAGSSFLLLLSLLLCNCNSLILSNLKVWKEKERPDLGPHYEAQLPLWIPCCSRHLAKPKCRRWARQVQVREIRASRPLIILRTCKTEKLPEGRVSNTAQWRCGFWCFNFDHPLNRRMIPFKRLIISICEFVWLCFYILMVETNIYRLRI